MITLVTVLGLTDPSGPWYLFWSGIGADLPMFGAGLTLYIKHQCHSRRCLRIGRHHTDNTIYCTRHHRKSQGGDSQ